MEWTTRWSEKLDKISQWASTRTKTISITEGFCAKPLALEVAEFVPMPGDMLERSWVAQGIKKSVYIPPYALFDIAKAESSYEDYINDRGAEFFLKALNPMDGLMRATYSAVFNTANSPETVSDS